jgi:tetratricopeptide (TPR) repeat protein
MEALLALAHLRSAGYNRRDLELARELVERILSLGQQTEAPGMLAGVQYLLGAVRYANGQFPAAREHFERAGELFGARPFGYYDAFFARLTPNILVNVLAILGYPETSIRKTGELVADARRSADPYSLAAAFVGYGMNHVMLRDTRMVAERADELLSITTEQENAFPFIMARFCRGWAMAAAGQGEQGIAEMRRTLSDPAFAEASTTALLLVAAAEICGKNGRAEEGLDLVAKGLAKVEQTGMSTAEAELHRVKAELLMIKDVGNSAEAERCLRTALDVARRQGARFFELRTTTSLARLLKRQGKRDEARAMLAEIYNWFTEGFEFTDLKDAKALLEELES